MKGAPMRLTRLLTALAPLAVIATVTLHGQGPTVFDPNLAVRTVVGGLTTPASFVFLGDGDMLVVEKNTGKVQHVVAGTPPVITTVLDLAVNSASERGLLGIALHPDFPLNPGVYLYWTCRADPPPASDPFVPTATQCAEPPMLGADSGTTLAVPLLGNRVDRFVWNGTSLMFDHNIVMLRSFQHDGAPQPPGQGDSAQGPAGNHNGGVIRFGPDGKLYIIMGDQGRRGQLQNLEFGPTPPTDDDQFGGPEPDNAHLSGMILRLNADGTAPTDNPFFAYGGSIGGQAGANLQKVFAYGIRNSFGMAFDPLANGLWIQVNGDDTFDEIERVAPGLNSGWVQIIGPVSRIAEFKSIEVNRHPPGQSGSLQQLRWPPTNLADTPQEALARLFRLPGSQYSDPEFSWKFAVAPAGIGFMKGSALGPQYAGDLFVGASRTTLANGYLFRFNLTGNRRKLGFDDPRLADLVADNIDKFDITESESLMFGRDFGVGTDIQTGPNGNLYIVSLTNGAIYEVFRRK
jgi:glucose/arabinose dehydrogenase